MDLSELNDSERHWLVAGLTETMDVCMDACGGDLHTWLFERAINCAFMRAKENQAAKLRHIYSQHGSKRWYFIDIPHIAQLFKLQLRDPDISIPVVVDTSEFASKDEVQEVVDFISLDEFYDALQSVNIDILERHPELHKPPKVILQHLPQTLAQAREWGVEQTLGAFNSEMQNHNLIGKWEEENDPSKLKVDDIEVKGLDRTEEHSDRKKEADQDAFECATSIERVQKKIAELRLEIHTFDVALASCADGSLKEKDEALLLKAMHEVKRAQAQKVIEQADKIRKRVETEEDKKVHQYFQRIGAELMTTQLPRAAKSWHRIVSWILWLGRLQPVPNRELNNGADDDED